MSVLDEVGLGRAFRLGKDSIVFERWGRDETYVRVFGNDGLIRDEMVQRWNAEEDRRKRT